MTSSISQLMDASLNHVFAERDEERRVAKIAEIYTEDVSFSDADGVVTGRVALNTKIQALLDATPGFVFTAVPPVRESNDLGLLEWKYGPAGQDPVVTGMDIVIVKDGRIASLHTLLMGP